MRRNRNDKTDRPDARPGPRTRSKREEELTQEEVALAVSIFRRVKEQGDRFVVGLDHTEGEPVAHVINGTERPGQTPQRGT